MSKSLGVDQSFTATAWVLLDSETDVIMEGVIQTDKSDTLMERSQQICSELGDVLVYNQPDIFSIEGLSYGSLGNATRNLAVLFGHIQSLCYDFEYLEGTNNWIETPATSLKKFATGNGKADKKMMLESLPVDFKEYLKLNYKGSGKKKGLYDIPDAYWLAAKGLEVLKNE